MAKRRGRRRGRGKIRAIISRLIGSRRRVAIFRCSASPINNRSTILQNRKKERERGSAPLKKLKKRGISSRLVSAVRFLCGSHLTWKTEEKFSRRCCTVFVRAFASREIGAKSSRRWATDPVGNYSQMSEQHSMITRRQRQDQRFMTVRWILITGQALAVLIDYCN